jgi:hypothetical protein
LIIWVGGYTSYKKDKFISTILKKNVHLKYKFSKVTYIKTQTNQTEKGRVNEITGSKSERELIKGKEEEII